MEFPYPEIPGRTVEAGEETVVRQRAISRGDYGRYDVHYNFYGAVDARGSTFGDNFVPTVGPDGRLRYTTGKIRDAEVLATVSNYVRPPAFGEAAARLRRDRVLILAGDPGSGRRAGAMALLREVVDDEMLVTLSPAATVEDLAEWEYRADRGYLVIDSESLGRGEDTDLAWESVAKRVRAAGTYLVVTTEAAPARIASTVVPYLTWQRPPIAEVLRGHLGANWPKDRVDRLVDLLLAKLPANYSLRWLACLARRVNARRDPAQALKEMDVLSGRQVERWFSQRRTRQELAEVAAAAFLAGTGERTYWLGLTRLEQLLVEHEPVRARQSLTDEPAQWYANTSVSGRGLLRVATVADPTGEGRIVVFKEHTYQRLAVARIREAGEGWFWNAVREWINELVDGRERLRVASGLAWLSCTRFDDVDASFLEPWSRGRLGWSGRVGATYVLWCMCREETTAPMALRTAIRWTGSGNVNQRATAVMAFSGELGVSYPTEAARRLWQLMTQSDDLCETSRTALGRLFATLVDQTDEAGAVLTMLDARRARFCVPEGKHRMRELTIEAILAMLRASSNRTGRPAVAELLRVEPCRREVVARLWSSAIRHEPARREALIALWQCLHAFRGMSAEAAPEAYALGAALAGALGDEARVRLAAELAELDTELRGGGREPRGGDTELHGGREPRGGETELARGGTEPPADVVVACVDALAAGREAVST
jgi:hypothetical protein